MLLPLRMRDNHLVRGLCQQSLVTVKPDIPPAKVITHDENNVGFPGGKATSQPNNEE
tara:strand:+ start:4218 stop:4388 length:171 start_codon:yes stop_codon:yes gene_type:complete